jgi:hypothetical protein
MLRMEGGVRAILAPWRAAGDDEEDGIGIAWQKAVLSERSGSCSTAAKPGRGQGSCVHRCGQSGADRFGSQCASASPRWKLVEPEPPRARMESHATERRRQRSRRWSLEANNSSMNYMYTHTHNSLCCCCYRPRPRSPDADAHPSMMPMPLSKPAYARPKPLHGHDTWHAPPAMPPTPLFAVAACPKEADTCRYSCLVED